MASNTAQIAKNKGNAAFKSGNWADAVGHYSAAVVADRTEPTYPLNRAAAYLKLGKLRDAERDCTTVLSLDGKNVKALFRRAQARAALEDFPEAEKDLLEAIKIEPTNISIKSELTTVQKRQLETTQRSTSKREPISIPPVPSASRSNDLHVPERAAPHSQRIIRNVPIEIIEPAAPKSNDILKPIHSRALSPSSHDSPSASTPALKTQPRVGGGIFRADGSRTIVRSPAIETTLSPKSATHSSPTAVQLDNSASSKASSVSDRPNVSIPPSQLTHFALTRTWNALSTPKERYSLLLALSPESFPVLFKNSLEPEFLVSMLRTFREVASPSTSTDISRFMCAIPSIPRFNTILLFLNQEEKVLVVAVWDAIDASKSDEGRHAWGL